MLAQISDNQYALYEAIDESNAIAERICQQNQSLLLGKVRKMCVDMAAPKESRPNRDGFFVLACDKKRQSCAKGIAGFLQVLYDIFEY